MTILGYFFPFSALKKMLKYSLEVLHSGIYNYK